MKHGLLVSILVCLVVSSAARADWKVKNPPSIVAGQFSSLGVAADGSAIWIVGKNGAAARSFDKGLHWRQSATGVTCTLQGVCFLDAATGWIVGGEGWYGDGSPGVILATRDSGNTWTMQYSSHDSYAGVKFFDKNNGWASGLDSAYRSTNHGVVLHTTDGGITWDHVSTGARPILTMDFIDVNTGALGSMGATWDDCLLTTIDAGKTWTRKLIGTQADYRRVVDVAMQDAKHICAVTDYEGVNLTSDGGSTWATRLLNQTIRKCASGGPGVWFVASGSAILKTVNEGARWDTVFTQPGIADICDLHFRNATEGYAVTARGIFLATANGGASWTVTQSTADFTSAWALSATSFLVGSTGGRVWKSTDVGEHWQENHLPTSADVTQILMTSAQAGWAATTDGIYTTTDGGSTWSTLTREYAGPLAVSTPTTLYASRHEIQYGVRGYSWYNSYLMRSPNNGKNWMEVYLFTNYGPSAIGFWNGNSGFAAYGATLVSTSDSGRTWKNLSTIASHSVRALALVGESTAWAIDVAAAGSVIRSIDGGMNWVSVLPTARMLSGLVALDPAHAWVCTGEMIYRTGNGGGSWDSIATGSGQNLNGIAMLNTQTGIAVGNSGKILITTDGGATGVATASAVMPHAYALNQNYPNPFNPSTTISFSLPSRSFVSLKIFDVMGRSVAVLASEELPAGTYARQWNAGDFSSGMYFYRLQAGTYSETKKLLLVR